MGFNELYRKHLSNYLIEAKEDKLIPFIQNAILKANNVTYNDLDDEKKVKLQGFINDKLKWYKDAIAKISSNEVYQVWLIRMIITGKLILPEDSEKVIELFKKFDKIKLRSDVDKVKKDIQKYNSVGELYDFVRSFNKAKVGESGIEYGENELLFTHLGKFDVIKISDYEDGKPLLQDSNWCVQHKNHFNNYGAPYYMIILNDGKRIERLALLHFGSKQFKDINDDAIDSSVEYYDDLVDILEELNKSENGDRSLVGGDFGVMFYYKLPDGERAQKFIDEIANDYDISDKKKAEMLNYDAAEILRHTDNIASVVYDIVQHYNKTEANRFIEKYIDIDIPYVEEGNIYEYLKGDLDIIANKYDYLTNKDCLYLMKSIVENFTSSEITDEIKESIITDSDIVKYINSYIYSDIVYDLSFDYENLDFLSVITFSRGLVVGYFVTDINAMKKYLDDYYRNELRERWEDMLLDRLEVVKEMAGIEDEEEELEA